MHFHMVVGLAWVWLLDQTEIMGIIAFVGLGLCMANILYDGYIIFLKIVFILEKVFIETMHYNQSTKLIFN